MDPRARDLALGYDASGRFSLICPCSHALPRTACADGASGVVSTATTTTTIIVHTSAASAVRNCCASGWTRIDIDLSDWTAAERESLAGVVVDTERGPKILREIEAIPMRSTQVPAGWSITNETGSGYHRMITIALDVAPPTAARLREIVAETVRSEAAEAAEAAVRRDAEYVAEEHELDSLLMLWRDCPAADLVNSYGENKVHYSSAIFRRFGQGCIALAVAVDRLAEAAAASAEIAATRARADEARVLAKDDAAAVIAALLTATLEGINPTLLPRHADGLLPPAELHRALRSLLAPACAGLLRPSGRKWRDSSWSQTGLTADQHHAWTSVREAVAALVLPGGATASASLVDVDSWRDAIGDDGEIEVQVTMPGVCLRAVVCDYAIKVVRML